MSQNDDKKKKNDFIINHVYGIIEFIRKFKKMKNILKPDIKEKPK